MTQKKYFLSKILSLWGQPCSMAGKKPPPTMTASTQATNSCSSCSAPIDGLRKAAEVNPSPWSPASHPCGRYGWSSGSWFWSGPALVVGTTWGVNKRMEYLSLPVSLSFLLFSFLLFQRNKYIDKCIFYRIGHFKETTHTKGINGKLTYFTSIFPTNVLKFAHTLLLCTSRCLKRYGKCHEQPIHISKK